MTHVCRQCARINPRDAVFCYWDGAFLAGGAAGPINAGSVPFPHQFVFPGGQICRNFDQLATTCQNHWQAAIDLLKQGFFASFLGGLGRADLALVAKEAAKFPDAERGLDQLLAKLPTQVLQPPRINVEPTMLSLGVLTMGTDRKLDLHLSNLGMRLVFGTVVSDCKWLTLGDGPAAAQKHFQFGAEAIIAVHVKGQFLRAGNQPLEGRLVVDSNAGTVTVVVRADVPITPFSDGILAGSFTPRQIAEKARAHPKEAAALFEKGLVSKWFTRNGWIYPVQGPNVGGLGGVQQFFEALGLAKPPRVELKTPRLELKGDPGQTVTASIAVGTPEKKHVFAFAISDQPWVLPGLQPKETKNPTLAAIPLTINVPWTPGRVQQAKITVTANGNQKFPVPLTLSVSGSPGDYVPVQAIPLPAGAALGGAVPIMATPLQEAVMVLPAAIAHGEAVPTAPLNFQPGVPARPAPPGPAFATPMPHSDPIIDLSFPKKRKQTRTHLIPLALLTLVLVALMLRDLIGHPTGDSISSRENADVEPIPRLAVFFDYGTRKEFKNTMSFGLVMVDPANPQDPAPKRLTFHPYGLTNSTVALIDGQPKMFGSEDFGKWASKPAKAGNYGGQPATFQFAPDPVFVTQTVEIIPGEAMELGPGVYKRLLDTCLIKYKVENKGNRSHKIGLRILVDTFIGNNDGTPFTIPGEPGLVSTSKDFRSAREVPDFIQALEYPDLAQPGTIVQINLKLADNLAPDRVSLTRWPGLFYRPWEVSVQDIGQDSAIVLYWNPVDMKPGTSREMAFSYGLGNVKGGKLGLTVGGTLAVNREMTVIAYVAEPKPGEKATLELPKGFELLENSSATQDVPPPGPPGTNGKRRPSPLTWRVRPTAEGRHILKVTTSTGLTVAQPVTIRAKGIF